MDRSIGSDEQHSEIRGFLGDGWVQDIGIGTKKVEKMAKWLRKSLLVSGRLA